MPFSVTDQILFMDEYFLLIYFAPSYDLQIIRRSTWCVCVFFYGLADMQMRVGQYQFPSSTFCRHSSKLTSKSSQCSPACIFYLFPSQQQCLWLFWAQLRCLLVKIVQQAFCDGWSLQLPSVLGNLLSDSGHGNSLALRSSLAPLLCSVWWRLNVLWSNWVVDWTRYVPPQRCDRMWETEQVVGAQRLPQTRCHIQANACFFPRPDVNTVTAWNVHRSGF